jgi:hypothetical protein
VLARSLPFVVVALLAYAPRARAQACCAGSSAVTPGRLALHEVGLVGLDARASAVVGSFGADGNYRARGSGTVEDDLEQDLFGSVRVFRHAQVSVLVPFVETVRRASTLHDTGGGIGDINLSARYDFLYAGQSRWVPGLALLAGVTFPTGRPVEPGTGPLAAGATGVGAFQINGAVAAEQVFGPWLVSLYGIVAARTPFSMDTSVGTVTETLAPQLSALASLAYVTTSEIALAAWVSLAYEGNPSIDGTTVPDSERITPSLGFGTVLPIGDHWRFQTNVAWNPPVLGQNALATVGLTWTLVRTWF